MFYLLSIVKECKFVSNDQCPRRIHQLFTYLQLLIHKNTFAYIALSCYLVAIVESKLETILPAAASI